MISFEARSALLALLTAAALACGREPAALSFAEVLGHQGDQVTTGLISVAGAINTDLLGYGWRVRDERGYAELVQSIGHIRFFAARAELRELVLHGALDEPGASRRYRVLLNGEPMGGMTFGADWQERRLALRPAALRRGRNHLLLRCVECPLGQRHHGPNLRVRQLVLRPAAAHRAGIRALPGEPAGFRMPAPSTLDLVAELPAAARFVGEIALAEGSADDGPTAALEITDDAGEHRVAQWSPRAGGWREVAADLGAWEGRLVRLRLLVDGARGAVLHWRRAVVTGRGGPPSGGRPPLAEPAPPPGSGRLGRPDVVVILLDAARADAFRPFGGPYPSPALERLAADGTRFTRVYAPAPWTLATVPALLTGCYPDAIGAGTWGARLALEAPTLAELLTAAGYRATLWHEHPVYRNYDDLTRGFTEVRRAPGGAAHTLPPAELLSTGGQPAFTFIHLLPPHAPYEPPAPFRGAYSSWYRGQQDVSAAALGRFPNPRDPAELGADDRRYIRDRYLEHAAYADSLVGRILERLDAAGRYDPSLIVVLSDHGEAFLEHGRFLHTRDVYDEMLHVPLIVKWPAAVAGSPRRVVEQPVSLVDLVPTLADGLALRGGHGFQGRSLLPAALDGDTGERPIYAVTRGASESWRPPRPSIALRHGRWKAVYEPLSDGLELYDLSADPGELEDLAAARPLMALLMRQAVLAQSALNRGLFGYAAETEAAAEPLDPETERQLRALGYLGEG